MRARRQYIALSGFALLLAATPVFAQKIKSDYDKSNDFSRYKKYAIGKNYLLTHQGLERQASIDRALLESLHRQLQSKGFVIDENRPDFRIRYEAGALTESAASTQPDMLTGGAPSPTWASNNLGGVPLDVWSSAVLTAVVRLAKQAKCSRMDANAIRLIRKTSSQQIDSKETDKDEK